MRPALLLCLLLTMMTPTTIARNADNPHAPTAAATPVPPPPAWLPVLEARYDAELRAAGLDDRVFTAEHWWTVTTPLLERKTAAARSLDELLFALIVLGDDRVVERTVVAGPVLS